MVPSSVSTATATTTTGSKQSEPAKDPPSLFAPDATQRFDKDVVSSKDDKTGQPTTGLVERVLLQGLSTENDPTPHRVCLTRTGDHANNGLEEGDPMEEGPSSAVV